MMGADEIRLLSFVLSLSTAVWLFIRVNDHLHELGWRQKITRYATISAFLVGAFGGLEAYIAQADLGYRVAAWMSVCIIMMIGLFLTREHRDPFQNAH